MRTLRPRSRGLCSEFLGAGLPAIFSVKQSLWSATIRWQASSYRGETGLIFGGQTRLSLHIDLQLAARGRSIHPDHERRTRVACRAAREEAHAAAAQRQRVHQLSQPPQARRPLRVTINQAAAVGVHAF